MLPPGLEGRRLPLISSATAQSKQATAVEIQTPLASSLIEYLTLPHVTAIPVAVPCERQSAAVRLFGLGGSNPAGGLIVPCERCVVR